MSDHLPPLNSLRTFEVAARHLSFSRAAEELHVTPAAVSQQIRALEAHYGMALFLRTTRSLVLTEDGQAALPAIREGFDRLSQADRRLRDRAGQGILTVSVYPSFAEKWLLPRLERFRARHPSFDLRIHAADDFADFQRDGVDIAIRYGHGRYDGVTVIPFLEETAYPVCSPELLKGAIPLGEPSDLRHHTLIHAEWRMRRATGANWRIWLKAAHVEDIDPERGLRFNLDAMTIQAAIDGLGVALVPSTLVEEDLKMGRLVRPFATDIALGADFRHYLVYPDPPSTKAEAFRDWAIEEAATFKEGET